MAMSQKSFCELAPSKVGGSGDCDLDPSSGEESDCVRLAKARKLQTSISIVHEFKPGQWGKVGDITVHRAQKKSGASAKTWVLAVHVLANDRLLTLIINKVCNSLRFKGSL